MSCVRLGFTLLGLLICAHLLLVVGSDDPVAPAVSGEDDDDVHICPDLSSNRIIGGKEVRPHALPYQLSLVIRVGSKTALCGAVLISERFALTAAHCLVDKSPGTELMLTAGNHKLFDKEASEQKRLVKSLTNHKKFQGTSNDISLLRVDPPFELNSKVQPIALPEEAYKPNGSAIVSGWGCTVPNCGGKVSPTLQWVSVPLISSDECKQMYSDSVITETMICAGYTAGEKDACQGDSGGPLMQQLKNCTRILIGLVSWGEGCAEAGKPGVYTNVSYFRRWIQDAMEGKGSSDLDEDIAHHTSHQSSARHQSALSFLLLSINLWLLSIASSYSSQSYVYNSLLSQ